MNRQQRRAAEAKTRGQPQSDADILQDFRAAVRLLQDGKLHQSEVAHLKVLAHRPDHAPTLHHLGLIAFKRNAKLDAVELIRRSVAADPAYHQAWLNLAVILGDLQRSEEAMRACRESIAIEPRHAPAHAVLGNLLRVAKEHTQATAAYANSLEIDRAQPSVLARLGELHLEGGDASTAAKLCAEALAVDAGNEDARALERRLLLTHGSPETVEATIAEQALTPAERALKLGQLGVHLNSEGRHEEAAAVLRRAIATDPAIANLQFDLAIALEAVGSKDEAFAAYQAGLAIEPNRADAYANVGTLLRSMDMMTGSLQVLTHAVSLDPKLAVAHYNLALTYKELNRFEEAHASFENAVACAPDSLIYRLEANNLKRVVCDWRDLAEGEALSLEQFRLQKTAVAPFLMLSFAADRDDQLDAGRRYAARYDVPPAHRFESYRGSAAGEKIRLGFLSGDFCEHATSVLLVEVLEQIDRSRFETFAYCFSPEDRSELRHRVVRSFDRFLTITDMSDAEAARRIHTDGIDVLIDLKGYTKNSRPAILAYRPAPIQVNYLGYPGTMGNFADYILADAVVAPMEHQAAYSEKIVHLPNCYQPNDRQRAIAPGPVSRAANGLPDDAFVFCSFNNSYKLNPGTFDVWMRLLRQVPGSVLWLLGSSDLMRDNLRREAEARGVEGGRLVFAGRLPFAEHLARHALADLFLDSLPCNAHTTTSDALWAGLPVLTCIGETFAGRVAASLLGAAGLHDLVTASLDDYEAVALSLAREPVRLRTIRERLIATRQSCALFDSRRYTRNLEQSFETMVTIMRTAEAPRSFSVVETHHAGPEGATAHVAPLANPRVLYDACPICASADIHYHIEAKVTGHPLYKPQLPPTMKWRTCADCNHVFTEGYFTPEACELVFSGTHANQKDGNDIENQRKVSARMVERVARYAKGGDWLDIGVGNGSLLFTAAEWGYRVVGTDLRSENVNKLRGMGFEAYCADIHELDAEGRFNVVSMADVLEHVPFPVEALQTVSRLMRPGGAIFVSMPNMDSIVWRALDVTQANPYWGELEHYHNFSRARLVALLEASGFRFAEYNISERYRSCMEVIAVKA